MQMWPIIKGIATWIPFAYDAGRGSTGGTDNARYCYAVWMRHLVLARAAGITRSWRSVAELGPGDSLGIGLAAMLCGADHLQALDVVCYANAEHNQAVLNQLAGLLHSRAPIPDAAEFPGVFPTLDNYSFPEHLLPEEQLRRALDTDRVARIGRALRGEKSDVAIDYRVPWNGYPPTSIERVDLLYSQAVLEHVEDAAATWEAMARWVAPEGAISHVIDLRSHRLTAQWDGHLQYPDHWWRIIKGRRPYLLNRCSPTEHCNWAKRSGFKVIKATPAITAPVLSAEDLAPRFREWSEDDRRTTTIHLIGTRQ